MKAEKRSAITHVSRWLSSDAPADWRVNNGTPAQFLKKLGSGTTRRGLRLFAAFYVGLMCEGAVFVAAVNGLSGVERWFDSGFFLTAVIVGVCTCLHYVSSAIALTDIAASVDNKALFHRT
ncbi:MAG: hypothetical protein ABIW82_17245 [Dokdonella sp.]